jgi:hypothetical protein
LKASTCTTSGTAAPRVFRPHPHKLGMSEGGVRHYLDQAREEWKAAAGAGFGDAADEEPFSWTAPHTWCGT